MSLRAVNRRFRGVVEHHPSSGVAFMRRKVEPSFPMPQPVSRLAGLSPRDRGALIDHLCTAPSADGPITFAHRFAEAANEVLRLGRREAEDREALAVRLTDGACDRLGASIGHALPALVELLWRAVPIAEGPRLAGRLTEAVCRRLEAPGADLTTPRAAADVRTLIDGWHDLGAADRQRVVAVACAIERVDPASRLTAALAPTFWSLDQPLQRRCADAVLAGVRREAPDAADGVGLLADQLEWVHLPQARQLLAEQLVEAAFTRSAVPNGVGAKIGRLGPNLEKFTPDQGRRLVRALTDRSLVDERELDDAVMGLGRRIERLDEADRSLVLAHLPSAKAAAWECETAIIAIASRLPYLEPRERARRIEQLIEAARPLDPWARARTIGAMPGGVSMQRLRRAGIPLVMPPPVAAGLP